MAARWDPPGDSGGRDENMEEASKGHGAIQAVKEMLADPDFGAGDFTGEDWRLATERVCAIREKVLADPRIAELEDRKYAEITRQVQNLKAVRRDGGRLES